MKYTWSQIIIWWSKMLHLSKKEVEMEKYELCVLCTLFIQKLLSDTFSSNASYCSVWPEMSIMNHCILQTDNFWTSKFMPRVMNHYLQWWVRNGLSNEWICSGISFIPLMRWWFSHLLSLPPTTHLKWMNGERTPIIIGVILRRKDDFAEIPTYL